MPDSNSLRMYTFFLQHCGICMFKQCDDRRRPKRSEECEMAPVTSSSFLKALTSLQREH